MPQGTEPDNRIVAVSNALGAAVFFGVRRRVENKNSGEVWVKQNLFSNPEMAGSLTALSL